MVKDAFDNCIKIGIAALTQLGYQEQESKNILEKLVEFGLLRISSEMEVVETVPAQQKGKQKTKIVAGPKKKVTFLKLESLKPLKSFCFFLGPGRSFTSLPMVVLALHPNCQVLNHGYEVLFPESIHGDFREKELPENMGWMKDYSHEGFFEFIQQVFEYSQIIDHIDHGSALGNSVRGGVRSSNVDWENIKLVKDDVKCIVWKDSKRLGNVIKTADVDVDYLLKCNGRLRFFMSVRNIIDTAHSTIANHFCPLLEFRRKLEKGEANVVGPVNKALGSRAIRPSLEQTVKAIIKDIGWFMKLRKTNPDRFFYIVEGKFNKDVLIGLAEFLSLQPDEQWI